MTLLLGLIQSISMEIKQNFDHSSRSRLSGSYVAGVAMEGTRQDSFGTLWRQFGTQLPTLIRNQCHEDFVSTWYFQPIVRPLHRDELCVFRFFIADKAVGAKGFKAIWTEIRDPRECGLNGYQCSTSKYCISDQLKCNGINNCGATDKSDEMDCTF